MLQTTERPQALTLSKDIEADGLVQQFEEPGGPGILWRVILVAIGFGVAMAGWMLVLTVFLAFIGLPVFLFGLALMQSQER
ncbi:MAG: hypothetical protein ACRDHS_11185 [Actinomycetota bacterium]